MRAICAGLVISAVVLSLMACGDEAPTNGATPPPGVGPSDAAADASVEAEGPLPPPITLEAQSGHRLRAVYWDLDGAKQSVLAPANLYSNRAVVFFDTALGEECAFTGRPDDAGRDYCIPLASLGEEAPFYADSSCTEKIAHYYSTASCMASPPRYIASIEDDDRCARARTLRHVGATVPGAFYRDPSSGACLAQTGEADEIFYRYGDEIPLSTFVSAQEVPGAGNGASIVPLDLVADDGARQRLLGWSTANAMPYTVDYRGYPVGSTGWTPARYALGDITMFADAACTQPVAQGITFLCPPTASSTSASESVGARALGALVTGPLFTLNPGAPCAPATFPNTGDWYSVGAPLSSATLPYSVAETGTGRLHPLYTATPEGDALQPYPSNWFPAELVDTVRQEHCVLTPTGGTDAVCVPPQTAGIESGIAVFSDRTCTSSALLFRYRDQGTPVPKTYNMGPPQPCSSPPVMRSVGAKLTVDAIYVNYSGACTAGSDSYALVPGDEVYALGDVVPLSAFATAKRVRE